MSTIIVFASKHQGNTRKVVEAIAKECEVELYDVTQGPKDLSGYDKIGFASGIYAANFDRGLLDFAASNLPNDKKVFFIYTATLDTDFSKSISKAIAGKNATVIGQFGCKGYNNWGPFKLMGGAAKGHPNQTDLANAVSFFKNTVEPA
ncbi:MAG: flavodoxin [Lachnospiraceae bacterium]|nr:flavodoxin [Lachnospiraceae bacterium]